MQGSPRMYAPGDLMGWIPDTEDARDLSFATSDLLSSSPIVKTITIDYRPHVVKRVQKANSCVAHALAGGCNMLMSLEGTSMPLVAVAPPYAGARSLMWPRQPLVDIGCSKRFLHEWTRKFGLVPETLWPETEENINVMPPVDVWQEGQIASLEKYHAIPEGKGCAQLVIEALRRRAAVTRAQMADEGWRDIGRKIYDQTDGPLGKVLGGHDELVVGYLESLDIFIIASTWPAGIDGDEGFVYQSSRSFEAMARDIRVIEMTPRID